MVGAGWLSLPPAFAAQTGGDYTVPRTTNPPPATNSTAGRLPMVPVTNAPGAGPTNATSGPGLPVTPMLPKPPPPLTPPPAVPAVVQPVATPPAPSPAPPAVPPPATAVPVQPVIPAIDPAPFLLQEQQMIAAITNATAEDQLILELKYDDIELLDLIKSLALQADVNILFDPSLASQTGVDGQPIPQPIVPAFRMSNVTAKQALNAILENYSLEMVHDPKTNTHRVRKKSPTALPPLITRFITLRYTNPTNLVAVLQVVVGERGKVTPDARTQQVIISATEDSWEMVNEVLDKMDTPVKQVLIEANIMETSKSPNSVRGIDWSGTFAAQNFGFGNGVGSGTVTVNRPGDTTTTTTTLPGGRTITGTQTAPASATETLTSTIGGLVPGVSLNTRDGFNPAVGFLNADGLRGVLSFLNTDADTEVISTPRSVMMDGQTARLQVTRAFPIFEITPGSANTPAGATITYTNLGTLLEVTPRVAANSNISLKVVPEVSNIDSKDRQTINGQLNEANVYAIRRIETEVMIPSGHTLVMGGLISDTQTKQYTKVPVFGDIPGLGWAFRRESNTRNKANLLIFVTPTILEPLHFQPPMTDFLHGVQQPTAEDFLKTPVPERKDKPTHWMDSGKPAEVGRSKWFKWGWE